MTENSKSKVWRRKVTITKKMLKKENRGVVLRWQRNRMGKPLSPPHIYRKNIWTPRKFYRTTSECWQRMSGTQKGSPLSLKGGRAKCKK